MADESFQQYQHQLAECIKSGTGELDGIEPRRLKIYQELFYNNVEGFCQSAFPVLYSILPQPEWQRIVRQFFQTHHSSTPHFIEISEEFLQFLAEQQILEQPQLLELAHYEWVELASSVAESLPIRLLTNPDLTKLNFQVPDSTFGLSYQYPVHVMSADNFDTIEPEVTHLVVYRDVNNEIKFSLVDGLAVFVLQLIEQNQGCSLDDMVTHLLQQNAEFEQNALTGYLQQALGSFIQQGIVVTS